MTTEPISERPGPPPLRIHHFLLCVVVAAIYLTWWHRMLPSSAVQEIPPWAMCFTAEYNSLAAIGFTLAVLSVYWHFKGYASLTQPGQWLLLSYLVFVVPMLLNNAFLKLFGFDWPGALQGYDGTIWWLVSNAWYFVLFKLIPLAFFAFCAWRVADSRSWRWVFIVSAILSVVLANWVSHILFIHFNVPAKTASAVPNLSTAGALLTLEGWAATTDVTRHRSRYWTHWVGIGLEIANQLLIAVGAIVALLGWF